MKSLIFLTLALLYAPLAVYGAVLNCPVHGPLEQWQTQRVGMVLKCKKCIEEQAKKQRLEAINAQTAPAKFDYDVTGKTTPIGLMLSTIEKPIKADYRNFSKQDYEEWLPNIRQMYYFNDRTDSKNINRPQIILRRNVKPYATQLVPEEEAFYDIDISCKTNLVPEIREPLLKQSNGSMASAYVRILQHVGQNLYIGEVSADSRSPSKTLALSLKDDGIPDGDAFYKVLFRTGQLYSYTTVMGAGKRIEVLSDDPVTGKMVPKITKLEPLPPQMDSVIEYLRDGGHLLVIRSVHVKSGNTVSRVDVLTEVFDTKKEQKKSSK